MLNRIIPKEAIILVTIIWAVFIIDLMLPGVNFNHFGIIHAIRRPYWHIQVSLPARWILPYHIKYHSIVNIAYICTSFGRFTQNDIRYVRRSYRFRPWEHGYSAPVDL